MEVCGNCFKRIADVGNYRFCLHRYFYEQVAQLFSALSKTINLSQYCYFTKILMLLIDKKCRIDNHIHGTIFNDALSTSFGDF